ncbi:MAG TPA: substrate-binding domain-containing protein [Stellaceae bacterium]|nr:substrate-binding domain-containing protein [Stellaceae bacterium]
MMTSVLLACAMLFALAAVPAAAAEIRVLSTMNIRPALEDLRGPFERATRIKVTIDYKGAAATRDRVAAGEAGDVVINARPTLDGLLAQGRIKEGSIRDIAHSSIGVVVRAGAPRPDISTDAAFQNALLAATSIAYPDPAEGSLGGNYFASLLEQLGLAGELMSKTTLVGGGAPAGVLVAQGQAQLGINQVAELMSVKGIEFLTPLPPCLTNKVVMAAAVLTSSTAPDAAAQWIKFLASPAAEGALKAHGMSP